MRGLPGPGGVRTLPGVVAVLVGVILLPGVGAEAQDAVVARIAADFASEIDRAMLEGRIPSLTAALVSGEEVVWTGAFGNTNVWARTPAVPSSVYLIGSTFKAQSTFALLRQMEANRFALDDPVRDHLDGLVIRGENPNRPVTFRHLLTHTSGLPVAFGPFPVWGDSAPPPLDDYLAADLEVVGPPEDSVRYSNLAYSLVAHLVEKLSGVPYREYIRDSIWAPLEMTSTAFAPTPGMEERLSIPYEVDDEGRWRASVRLKASVWPAGIVYGTIHDQANWLIANLNGGTFRGRRLLREETHDEMLRLQFPGFAGPMAGGWGYDAERTGYGLTWWVSESGGERYFAHSGSVPGYTAFVAGNRDRRIGVVLLTNGHRAHPHLVGLSRRALELLRELSPPDGS